MGGEDVGDTRVESAAQQCHDTLLAEALPVGPLPALQPAALFEAPLWNLGLRNPGELFVAGGLWFGVVDGLYVNESPRIDSLATMWPCLLPGAFPQIGPQMPRLEKHLLNKSGCLCSR